MPRKAWFFYENVLGKWCPVVRYVEHSVYKYPLHETTAPVALQPEDFDLDEAMSFSLLTRKYPPPQEKKMVRPVEGFISKDGKFFTDKDECTIHESVYNLNYKLFEALNHLEISEEGKTYLLDQFMEFTYENKEDFYRYFEARDNLASPAPENADTASEGEGGGERAA